MQRHVFGTVVLNSLRFLSLLTNKLTWLHACLFLKCLSVDVDVKYLSIFVFFSSSKHFGTKEVKIPLPLALNQTFYILHSFHSQPFQIMAYGILTCSFIIFYWNISCGLVFSSWLKTRPFYYKLPTFVHIRILNSPFKKTSQPILPNKATLFTLGSRCSIHGRMVNMYIQVLHTCAWMLCYFYKRFVHACICNITYIHKKELPKN
jgi:hypothetical protein